MTMAADTATRAQAARNIVASLTSVVSPPGIAALYAVCDDVDALVAELERVAREREKMGRYGKGRTFDEMCEIAAARLKRAREAEAELAAAAGREQRLRGDLAAARAAHLGDARFANEMINHFPVEIRCDHDTKQDMVVCDCGRVNLGWHPSVRAAKEAWARHVIDTVKAARAVLDEGQQP